MASIEDDWRQAKDATERKRVQNRVAQRTYRKRMKRRVEELEEEIDRYRSCQHPARQCLGNGQNSMSDAAARGQNRESVGEDAAPPHMSRPLLPGEMGRRSSLDFLPHDLINVEEALLHVDQATWRQSGALPLPSFAPLAKPQTPDCTSVWSLRGRADQQPQGPIDESMHFHDTPGSQDRWMSAAPTRRDPQIDFTGDPMGVGGARYTAAVSPTPSITLVSNGSSEADGWSNKPLEDRFDLVHRCLQSAGFDSFDALFSQFYTSHFSCGSAMSTAQRVSRQTHLPVLLANLRERSKSWTAWEAHGYEYEVLKSAESIVNSECKQRVDVSSSEVNLENNGDVNRKMLEQMVESMQRKFPKLWTLIEAFAGSRDGLGTRSRPYDLLAMMIILNPPHAATTAQISSWVAACLEAAV